MGRYTTRFQANGANAVGATYTAAAGGGNSDYSVAANGQALLRTDYPALSAYYSGQTNLDTLKDPTLAFFSSGFTSGGVLYTPSGLNRGQNYGGGQVSVKFSGFYLYMQPVVRPTDTGLLNTTRIWYTQDAGVSWKLTDFVGSFASGGLIATQSAVYICHESGLHRTTDGLNYTYVYNKTPVYGITEQSGTVIFTTGDTTFVRTSTGDFVNLTGVTASGAFTPYPVVNYSGVLYAFTPGATGVRFSTNTGQTWTSPTSGRSTASGGYYATVANNYVLVFGYGTGVPIYEYSTNPTGTTNTWTAMSRTTRNDTASSVVYCTSVEYDSDTNNLLVGWQHFLNGSGTQEIFGYIATGITGAAIPCTGTLTGCVFSSGGYVNGYSYPFFIASGTKKTLYNDWLFKVELTSGTWDSSVTSVSLVNSTTNIGYSTTPFIPASDFSTSGYAAIGTTNSGNRYVVKCNSATNGSGLICGAYIETSGFFKQLTSVSGSTEYLRANYGLTSTGFYKTEGSNLGNMLLAEASGVYILGWSLWSQQGVFYNRYNQTTLKSNTDFLKQSFTTSNLYNNALYTKDDGIYFIDTMPVTTTRSGVLVPASGTPLSFSYLPGGAFNVSATGYSSFYSSHLHNEVIITTTTAGNNATGVTTTLNRGIVSYATFTLLNATGGTLSMISGTVMLKSQNKYYAIDPSGIIYQGETRYALTRYGAGPSIFPPGASLAHLNFREISASKIIGPVILNNNYGNVSTIPFKGGVYTTAYLRHPDLFQYTDSSYILVGQGNYVSADAPFSGTGYFTVPNITSASSGEAKYIIAR